MPEKKIQLEKSDAVISRKVITFSIKSEGEFLSQLLKSASEQELVEYFKEFPESIAYWNRN